MKKSILVILFLTFALPCFAELVVIYDKDTKEIYSVSEKDDTILPVNCEKKIIAGNISDFMENPTNYKFSGGKFIKNIDKIDKQEQERIKQDEKQAEEKIIQDRIKKIAIDQLTSEGITFKYN